MQRSLSQKKRDQAAARKQYNNEWQIGLMNAPCADPGFCCYAFFCGQCAAYGQRKLQMGPAWPSQYTCCNGGTCISGRCGEQSNPELCLCCEVVCCFPSAMATTRFMIQDEQRVMNTQCDNCLIGFMLLVLLALRRDGVAKPRYRTIGRRRGLPGGSHVRQRVRVHAHATASANQIPRQRRKHRPDGTDGGWRDDRAATADDASRCAIRSASCRATAASDVRVHGASDASVPATAPRRELLPDGLGTKFTRRYQQ